MDKRKLFMGLYKAPYHNSKEPMFGAFGIRPLEPLSEYVHPDNNIRKSFANGKKTESIVECIGEAVPCLAKLISQKKLTRISASPRNGSILVEADIPAELKPVFGDIRSFAAQVANGSYAIACFDGNDVQIAMPDVRQSMTAVMISMLVSDLVEARQDISADMTAYCVDRDPQEGFKLQDWNEDARYAYIKTCVDFYHAHKNTMFEDESSGFEVNAARSSCSVSKLKEVMDKYLVDKVVVRTNIVRPKRVARKTKFAPEDFPVKWHELIPSIPEGYVVPEYAYKIAKGIMAGKVTCLLEGPAGTGKSTVVDIVASMVQAPIVAKINCTNALDEFILGKFMPKEGTNGEIAFVQSEVADAIEQGGWVVFEEINMASARNLAFLNSLLDGNKMVRLDNGKVIRRHPHFRLFATMNPGYAGTREMNPSLRDRFNYDGIVPVPELAIPAIRQNLLTHFWLDERVLDAMLTVYKKIKNYLRDEQEDVPISPRGLIGWATTIQEEYDCCNQDVFEAAAEKNIIPLAGANAPLAQALRELIKGVAVPNIVYPQYEE